MAQDDKLNVTPIDLQKSLEATYTMYGEVRNSFTFCFITQMSGLYTIEDAMLPAK